MAFNIANWSGPNGANLSNTIERAYQQAIHEYNNTGQEMLIEMSRFPTEIEEVRKKSACLKVVWYVHNIISLINYCIIIINYYSGMGGGMVTNKDVLGTTGLRDDQCDQGGDSAHDGADHPRGPGGEKTPL